MSPSEAIEQLGPSPSAGTNRSGEAVFRYSTMWLTFDAEGLAEVQVLPEGSPRIRKLNSLSLTDLVHLVDEDGDAQQVLGCVVLLNLGVSITGVHDADESQLSCSAFRRGRWDRLREEMTPIDLSHRKVR